MCLRQIFTNGVLLVLLAFFFGCGPRTLDDFEEEGEGVMRSLIQDLRSVRTRDQLLASTVKLKRQFERLVDIMIAAQEYRKSHPEIVSRGFSSINHELSDQLRIELNRLYHMEGGRQIIEKSQENALHRLDAYEKRLKRLAGCMDK